MMFTIIILAALPRVFAFEKVLTDIRCGLDGWSDVPHGRDGAEQGNDGKLFEFDCQKRCYDSKGWEGKRGRKMACGYSYRDAKDLNDWDKVIVDVKTTINQDSCGDHNYERVADWDSEGFRAEDSSFQKGGGKFFLCYRTRSLGDVKKDPNERIVTELIAKPDPLYDDNWDYIGKWDNHDWSDAWAWINTQDGWHEERKTRFFIELHEKKAQLEKETSGCQWIGIPSDQCPSDSELENLLACMIDMKRGDRCRVFDGQLPNKENGDINNCGEYDVFEYTCAGNIGSKNINSGDTIYLKGHEGSHIEVQDKDVRARWNDQGNWQTLIIEKADGGAVLSGDTVFFTTHRNLHIDVEGEYVRARYGDQGDWQRFVIEKASGVGEMIYEGETIYLRSHTGKYVDVKDSFVRARYEDKGDWQALTIETVPGTQESSLNAYSALNSSEDFVVYGLAFVGLITILVLLRSTFQRDDYKAIDEASKLEISSAEL